MNRVSIGRHCCAQSTHLESFNALVADEILAEIRTLEVDEDWWIIRGEAQFFTVTKGFHNALQGGQYELTDEVRGIYEAQNQESARLFEELKEGFGLVVSEALCKGRPVVAGRAENTSAPTSCSPASSWTTWSW